MMPARSVRVPEQLRGHRCLSVVMLAQTRSLASASARPDVAPLFATKLARRWRRQRMVQHVAASAAGAAAAAFWTT
eukprot:9504001-Pyramimonas_sp.AAC.2